MRIPSLSVVVVLALVASGCLSSNATDPSKVVVPKDPSGLAKCKVQKSSASPLVTEWPASEKAHLEGMLSDRAVVVSYSGCEMRLLDACEVPGSYKFKRTSLSSDVIEIKNEDDLYAKVPLGAASLEGELAASGRLAIKTTVAGQMRLEGGVGELPENGACKGATHVVSALSVGAFELVSGGAVSGRAGVQVASAGAGVHHERNESTMRSAGSPSSCKETAETPNPDCSSPIQVFLVPLEHAPRASDEPADSTDADDAIEESAPSPEPETEPRAHKPHQVEPPRERSVEIDFERPAEDERWMLLSRDGELLCELPCTRRVDNNSGMKLQLDANKKEDIKVVAVPNDLGYSPGRRVKAVPQPAYNNTAAAWMFYGGILATLGGAIWIAALQKEGTCTDNPGDGQCIGTYALMGGGGALALAGGIWWYTTSQDEELVMTLGDDEAARITIGPGVLTATF